MAIKLPFLNHNLSLNLFQDKNSTNSFLLMSTNLLTTILLLLLLLLLLHSIRKDYLAFLALGPGGIPSTPKGYLHLCLLRPFALRNPFAPPLLEPALHPRDGFLSRTMAKSMPTRRGPRPVVRGIAPQRQITQRGTENTYKILTGQLIDIAHTHARTHGLYTDTSCFEKHSVGIFCTPPPPPPSFRSSVIATCNGEVCHAHPSDGSLHLTLHPADVRTVLEKGWGQRHPLARDRSWWWGLVRKWDSAVPPGFVMVYAPRDEKELTVVLEIVRAAVCWVSGRGVRSNRGLGSWGEDIVKRTS